jgi:hypothetical protein
VTVAAGTITTVVGGGIPGFSADGPGPWLVNQPAALAMDRDALYFADTGNARIRVLNLAATTRRFAGVDVPSGQVATICGSGVRGNSGDGGAGVSAQIDSPRGMFVVTKDGEGISLFFTDGPQNVLRMLDLTDVDQIAAVDAAGNAVTTAPADSVVTIAGGPNTPGTPNFPAFDGDGREASAMRFSDPWGVVVAMNGDALAHVIVLDEGNDRVRRFGAPPVRSRLESP